MTREAVPHSAIDRAGLSNGQFCKRCGSFADFYGLTRTRPDAAVADVGRLGPVHPTLSARAPCWTRSLGRRLHTCALLHLSVLRGESTCGRSWSSTTRRVSGSLQQSGVRRSFRVTRKRVRGARPVRARIFPPRRIDVRMPHEEGLTTIGDSSEIRRRVRSCSIH